MIAITLLLACSSAPTNALAPHGAESTAPTFGGTAIERVLFRAGDLGVHTYRIPALAWTTNGTWLAVCDARQDNSSDLPGNIDLVMRRSVDGGLSWSPIETILDLPEGHGAGDPSLLVDRNSGRLFCFFAYGPPGVGFFSSQAGSNDANDPNTLHAQVITSDDDGLTWSSPIDLNPQIKDPAWEALFASSGHGIQMRSGRLVQPYAVRDGAGVVSARNALSDDGGATWHMGAAAGSSVNESKVFERNDGNLVQNMRHNSTKKRFLAVSTDAGESWGPMTAHPTLIDPNVNASVEVASSTASGATRDVLLFSNPRNTAARTNMTVQLSYDEGASFPRRRVVHDGPAAYSSLVARSRQDFGLLFEGGEVGSVESIRFVAFDMDWLLDGHSTLREDGRPNRGHPSLWACFASDDPNGPNGPGTDIDGAAVSRWDDTSDGGHHDLSRSSGGVGSWDASSIAGRPSVEFGPNSDVWGSAGGGGEFQTLPNPFTMIFVARVDELQGGRYLLDKSTNAGGVGLRISPSDPSRFELRAGRNFSGPAFDALLPSAPIAVGEAAVHRVVLRGSSLRHFVNGLLVASLDLPDGGEDLHQGGLLLGGDVGASNHFTGAIAEFFAYSEALSPGQANKLEAYLRRKYRL